ncbi:hypothetical protein BDV37DRAFT_242902 [Aspergillus pseudonomiae]|uniref:Tse2 ADP-ribosyltransferase toxin domain-containing protein n=1 Tax=Aspergillus pseudonomiae TaxID=1506151 RepID=A0A5N7DJI3_9EURO|nr:uncharacterized protein BDV37DRAFT_242902 [Aspergillus pseudonomiae]KAE8406289.1 hypothetical protein BDV37DRAFT_242902 [Aspergillus pseudonomiae]
MVLWLYSYKGRKFDIFIVIPVKLQHTAHTAHTSISTSLNNSSMMLTQKIVFRFPSRGLGTRLGRRDLSLLSVHSSFPCTMYRFQLQRGSALFDCNAQNGRFPRDGVPVSKDGLVYPGMSKLFPYLHGPVFRPNTLSMQEILRQDYDLYDEELEAGHSPVEPQVIHIPKGRFTTSNHTTI